MRFQEQPLVQHKTVAEVLLQARTAQPLPVKQLAADIKVSTRYLEALEQGRYNDLPSPVYIRQYLRLYCQRLGLSWESMQKLFEEEIQIYYDTPTLDPKPSLLGLRKQPRLVAKRSYHNSKPLLISHWVRRGAIGVIISLLLSYFIWSIIHLVSPPALELWTPDGDTQTDQVQLTVSGKSSPQAQVRINDQVVPLDTTGKFSSTILLHDGLNTIKVSAANKQSKPRVITRHILYHAVK